MADRRFPLLERVRFLAIFAEGLDEFFQVRVAGLEDQVAAGLRAPLARRHGVPTSSWPPSPPGPPSWWSATATCSSDQVRPALTAAGMVLADWHTLDDADRSTLGELFSRGIFPILTPLAMGQGHPFPAIANLSLNLVVRVADPLTGEERIAQVKVPPLLPRLVPLADGRRFVLVEQVVAAHLDSVFPGMRIEEHQVFRVTRNVDLSVDEDETEDLRGRPGARAAPTSVRPGRTARGLRRASPPTSWTCSSPRSMCPRTACTWSTCRSTSAASPR